MKYSVEIENGIAKETLVFNGKEYTRTTKRRTDYSLSTDDKDFSEQIENEGLNGDVVDQIYDTLDDFLTNDLLGIAESEEK